MNATGYKVLGFAVWRGAKWYARRRLPSAGTMAASAAGALAALGAAAAIARRAAR
ncbi:MAG TPA: hypothetical protein VGI27_09380 [Solirubrobacteraceae bacterium]